MDRKIRILVITYLPWRDDNSIGNSYSNIFQGTDKDKYEFAHIYIRDGMPQNKLCHEYYHISEKSLIKRFFGKKVEIGHYFHMDKCEDQPKDQFSKLYNKARILRWDIFFLFRDLIGKNKGWQNKQFNTFLDMFEPDIVFGTLPTGYLITNLMLYVKDYCGIPLVSYPWDDYYSLDHSNLSPIFWVRKFLGRSNMRKVASASSFMYVISNLMQDEYKKIFKKDCRLLFKGHVFEDKSVQEYSIHEPINIVYMGNIGGGRWKTLACLADGIRKINVKYGKIKMILNIYTLSPTNEQINNVLNIVDASRLNDSVPNEKVVETMEGADILVHAEPYRKSEYQFYRASFSTKLVDYFYRRKAILSLGGMTASTDYLIRNDATLYIKDRKDIVSQLERLVENPDLIIEYAKKSWNCGVRNHQILDIQKRVYNDFCCLLNEKSYGNKKLEN